MSLQSDAQPFDTGPTPKNMETEDTTNTQTVSGEKTSEGGNKSEGFLPNRGPTAEAVNQQEQAQPNTNSRTFDFHPNTSAEISGSSEKTGKFGKTTKNVYNIRAKNITGATIGSTGPVKINTKSEVFKHGAKKQDFCITDGTFTQTNIGGKSTYNNERSSTTAGGSAASSNLEIPDFPPYSPEQVLLKLLQSGVSSNDLISLLEMEYSVANLAFALPSNPHKRNAIVNALMCVGNEMEAETS